RQPCSFIADNCSWPTGRLSTAWSVVGWICLTGATLMPRTTARTKLDRGLIEPTCPTSYCRQLQRWPAQRMSTLPSLVHFVSTSLQGCQSGGLRKPARKSLCTERVGTNILKYSNRCPRPPVRERATREPAGCLAALTNFEYSLLVIFNSHPQVSRPRIFDLSHISWGCVSDAIHSHHHPPPAIGRIPFLAPVQHDVASDLLDDRFPQLPRSTPNFLFKSRPVTLCIVLPSLWGSVNRQRTIQRTLIFLSSLPCPTGHDAVTSPKLYYWVGIAVTALNALY
ncbi:hypothetical protein PSTT_05434, partial [Puccinia striiformis]